MCGRYLILEEEEWDELDDQWQGDSEIVKVDDITANFNAAPTHENPVIFENDNAAQLKAMRWGLIPFWAKDHKIGYKMINARSETVTTKPAWRNLVGKRRCAVLANGYYEWIRRGKHKVPMCIRPGHHGPVFFAGLWDSWKSPGGDMINSYTIMTTQAAESVAHIHDRMPVFLAPEMLHHWVSMDTPVNDAVAMLKPYEDELDHYAVSDRINKVGDYNDASLLEPVAVDTGQDLGLFD